MPTGMCEEQQVQAMTRWLKDPTFPDDYKYHKLGHLADVHDPSFPKGLGKVE